MNQNGQLHESGYFELRDWRCPLRP